MKPGQAHPRLALSSDEPPRMTVEEWAALPEDEPGELVDGWLVEEEMADYAHETVVSFLNALLRGWAVPKGGFVGGSEAKLALGPELGRKPDLTVYLAGGHTPPRHGLVRVPPDILVEVLSPTAIDIHRDRVEKLRDYAAFGVRWYWLLDPEARSFEVIDLATAGGPTLMLADCAGTLPCPGCDGLAVDLDALWAEIDRLGPATQT
jgi:Uma2 family endonuclease